MPVDLTTLMNRQEPRAGYIEFTQWLRERLALSPDTASNYFSAVNRIRRLEETGESLEAYFSRKTTGWERTCHAAWKHYIDWCALYMAGETPQPLGAMTGEELSQEVIVAVDRLVNIFGVSAIQRLRWSEVGDGGTQVFDVHGSPLKKGRDSSKAKQELHRNLTIIAEYFPPEHESSPVVPRTQGSDKPSNRARLRAIQGQVPKKAAAETSPTSKLNRSSSLADSPMPTQAEYEAVQAHFPKGFIPGAGEATGRPARTLEELEEEANKPIADWALQGLSAELTGHFPADATKAAEDIDTAE